MPLIYIKLEVARITATMHQFFGVCFVQWGIIRYSKIECKREIEREIKMTSKLYEIIVSVSQACAINKIKLEEIFYRIFLSFFSLERKLEKLTLGLGLKVFFSL